MEYLIMIILLSTLLFEVYKQIPFKGIPQKKPGAADAHNRHR